MPHSMGGRGPKWTPEEDRELHELATENRKSITDRTGAYWDSANASPFAKRLATFAKRRGRTYGAVLKRAQRIKARSYRLKERATR